MIAHSASLDRVRRIVYLCAAFASAATRADGQAPSAPTAASRGRVLGVFSAQTGDPIEGAQVIDMVSRTSALTTGTGTVSLAFLADTGSLVRVQKLGYQPATLVVSTAREDTLPVTVMLRAAPPALPAVVTRAPATRYRSPGLQAFEERRLMGVGRFVSEAELRKADNRSMTNVIRGMGLKAECSTRVPIRCFATSTRTGGMCELDVYQDGIRVNRDDRDLEKIPVNTMGGVEAYLGPATIPPLYNQTGSACGVLLFWTRER
jgi:hypothetical protein